MAKSRGSPRTQRKAPPAETLESLLTPNQQQELRKYSSEKTYRKHFGKDDPKPCWEARQQFIVDCVAHNQRLSTTPKSAASRRTRGGASSSSGGSKSTATKTSGKRKTPPVASLKNDEVDDDSPEEAEESVDEDVGQDSSDDEPEVVKVQYQTPRNVIRLTKPSVTSQSSTGGASTKGQKVSKPNPAAAKVARLPDIDQTATNPESSTHEEEQAKQTLQDVAGYDLFQHVKFINMETQMKYGEYEKGSICNFVMKHIVLSDPNKRCEFWEKYKKHVNQKIVAMRNARSTALRWILFGK